MNIPPHVFEAIALAKCDYANVHAERACDVCGALSRIRPGAFAVCTACRETHKRRQELAGHATRSAVAKGAIPDPRSLVCVDCGAPGWCYDHRDYDKPLDVAPVCRSCNGKRGVAKAA